MATSRCASLIDLPAPTPETPWVAWGRGQPSCPYLPLVSAGGGRRAVVPTEPSRLGGIRASGGSVADSQFNARSISDEEAAVVERMLAVATTDPSVSGVAAQVRNLQVVGRCTCGCASVDFRSSTDEQPWRIVADASGISADGEPVGLFLWAVDDGLAGLEVYNFSENPAPLPLPDSISRCELEQQDGRRE